jgi:elongation factor P--(R)-beta-lysine ligase
VSSSSPFWLPERHAARRPALVVRAKLKAALRAAFEAKRFWEVETGIIQISPGNETHLHAFSTRWRAPGEGEATGYLITSPEFAMKKLLAAGESHIYQFTPCFRAREISRLHSPEFTMLEFYRAGQDYTELMQDCAWILRVAARIGKQDMLTYNGLECDHYAEPERLSVCAAFSRHAGMELEPLLGNRDAFAAAALDRGIRIALDDTWSDIFSRVMAEKIEPKLGVGRATLLDRYPISEAALARPCPDDPRFAERFEFYVCGIELANAFGELTDAAEQRRRFETDMAEKQRLYGESYPLDEDFLAALQHMPAACGMAMGFDRLAMLAAGASSVEEVIFTPWPLQEQAAKA